MLERLRCSIEALYLLRSRRHSLADDLYARCIQAAIGLMRADLSNLGYHNAFNVSAMSFSAGELAAEIKKHIPDFECEFRPDERQAIADSWPRSLDDSVAREEWGWQPRYDLARMTSDMLAKLSARQQAETF